MKKTLLRLRVALILISASLTSFAQTVLINEIRIDQPSTDDDEYFELAGTAGQDLSYNFV